MMKPPEKLNRTRMFWYSPTSSSVSSCCSRLCPQYHREQWSSNRITGIIETPPPFQCCFNLVVDGMPLLVDRKIVADRIMKL